MGKAKWGVWSKNVWRGSQGEGTNVQTPHMLRFVEWTGHVSRRRQNICTTWKLLIPQLMKVRYIDSLEVVFRCIAAVTYESCHINAEAVDSTDFGMSQGVLLKYLLHAQTIGSPDTR
jgi:hypothetical protein